MKPFLVLLAAVVLVIILTGCSGYPYVVEYYPPATPAERARGHGAYKKLDYRRPKGNVDILNFSIF